MHFDQRILETIVTTTNADGSLNVSPMGPIVDAKMQHVLFRPYQTSTTFQNLQRTRQGVLHVTDEVSLFAHSAVRDAAYSVETMPARVVQGEVIRSACRWYEFRITGLDTSQDRAELQAEIVHCERLRDFFGFNRAMHAVIEAAILATRTEFLPAEQIREQICRLAPAVEKTGAREEQEAFEFLRNYIEKRL